MASALPKLAPLVALVLLALPAVAAPPPAPWVADPSHVPSPYFTWYLDARLETAAFGDCVAPFNGLTGGALPTTAMVCGEFVEWLDADADNVVEAGEYVPLCPPNDWIQLSTGSGHWGPFGILVGGVPVYTGPVTLAVASCDPTTGHWHAAPDLFFPLGNDPTMLGVTLDMVVWNGGLAVADTDVY